MKSHFAFALVLAGCGGSSAPSLLAPPPESQGFQVMMEMDAPAAAETWQCVVMSMPNQDTVNINRVEHAQTAGLHHMDLTALVSINLAPGRYDCTKLYADHPELMDQTTIYAAQSPTAKIDLGPGVVARVPPGLPVMFELHYVNATAKAVHVESRVNAYTIDAHAVTTTISGGALRRRHLDLPPHADTTSWARCVMDKDVDLLLLASHTHKLGRDVRIFSFDGSNSGAELYVNTMWATPNLQQFHPSVHLAAGTGLEVRCHYFNDTDATVNWGYLAADEMCNMVMVWTPGETPAKCTEVATSDGILDP
jgi:hypothetical protein